MAKTIDDWLGQFIENELQAVLSWKTHIKREPGTHSAEDGARFSDDGSNFRSIFESSGSSYKLQLREVVQVDKATAVILLSDGFTQIKALLLPSALATFEEEIDDKLSMDMTGDVIALKSFEVLSTPYGSNDSFVSLQVSEIQYLFALRKKLGNPLPVQELQGVSNSLEAIKRIRIGQQYEMEVDGDVTSPESLISQAEELNKTPPASRTRGSKRDRPETPSDLQSPSQLLVTQIFHPSVPSTTSKRKRVGEHTLSNDGFEIEVGINLGVPISANSSSAQTKGRNQVNDKSAATNPQTLLGLLGKVTNAPPKPPPSAQQTTKPDIQSREATAVAEGPASVPSNEFGTSSKQISSIESRISNTVHRVPYGRWKIPSEQQRVVDAERSWFPSRTGDEFPVPNIPIELLKLWDAVAEQKTKHQELAIDPVHSSSNSETGSSDNESSRSATPLDWSSSPQRPQQPELPPDSTIGSNNLSPQVPRSLHPVVELPPDSTIGSNNLSPKVPRLLDPVAELQARTYASSPIRPVSSHSELEHSSPQHAPTPSQRSSAQNSPARPAGPSSPYAPPRSQQASSQKSIASDRSFIHSRNSPIAQLPSRPPEPEMWSTATVQPKPQQTQSRTLTASQHFSQRTFGSRQTDSYRPRSPPTGPKSMAIPASQHFARPPRTDSYRPKHSHTGPPSSAVPASQHFARRSQSDSYRPAQPPNGPRLMAIPASQHFARPSQPVATPRSSAILASEHFGRSAGSNSSGSDRRSQNRMPSNDNQSFNQSSNRPRDITIIKATQVPQSEDDEMEMDVPRTFNADPAFVHQQRRREWFKGQQRVNWITKNFDVVHSLFPKPYFNDVTAKYQAAHPQDVATPMEMNRAINEAFPGVQDDKKKVLRQKSTIHDQQVAQPSSQASSSLDDTRESREDRSTDGSLQFTPGRREPLDKKPKDSSLAMRPGVQSSPIVLSEDDGESESESDLDICVPHSDLLRPPSSPLTVGHKDPTGYPSQLTRSNLNELPNFSRDPILIDDDMEEDTDESLIEISPDPDAHTQPASSYKLRSSPVVLIRQQPIQMTTFQEQEKRPRPQSTTSPATNSHMPNSRHQTSERSVSDRPPPPTVFSEFAENWKGLRPGGHWAKDLPQRGRITKQLDILAWNI